MAAWFATLFPEADDEDQLVLLYSFHTPLGDWGVQTPIKTFKIRPTKERSCFYLQWAGQPLPGEGFDSVYAAVQAVAGHKTGVAEWDSSSFEAPDYLRAWKRQVPGRTILNFLDSWIRSRPNGSLREMVDYFEHEDTHLVNRRNIKRFLERMIMYGQLERLPSDFMTPAELRGVVRLARRFRIPLGPADSRGPRGLSGGGA